MTFLDTGILVGVLLERHPAHFAHAAPEVEILTP